MIIRLFAVCVALLLAGAGTVEAAESRIIGLVGEPSNGFPSWQERVVHEWHNRARSDPQADLATCTGCGDRNCYGPVEPLSWSLALNRAARFHAAHMTNAGFFSHSSPCILLSNISSLYPDLCNGLSSCSCAGPGATSFDLRIALFGGAARGENIAGTGEPNTAFYLWLHEPSGGGCQFTLENGHRWNMLTTSGSVGIGVTTRTVADFGAGSIPTKIVSGAHYPRQASTVEAWANWYDTAAPTRSEVVLDGVSLPMTRRRGTGTNGAWSATLTGVGSGTHSYYFVFRDAAGMTYTYPTTGSFNICSGTCADWTPARPSSNPLPGDVNADGFVTIADIFYLFNHLYSGGPAPLGSGDANSDGSVTSADGIFLINYLFAGGPTPSN